MIDCDYRLIPIVIASPAVAGLGSRSRFCLLRNDKRGCRIADCGLGDVWK